MVYEKMYYNHYSIDTSTFNRIRILKYIFIISKNYNDLLCNILYFYENQYNNSYSLTIFLRIMKTRKVTNVMSHTYTLTCKMYIYIVTHRYFEFIRVT